MSAGGDGHFVVWLTVTFWQSMYDTLSDSDSLTLFFL